MSHGETEEVELVPPSSSQRSPTGQQRRRKLQRNVLRSYFNLNLFEDFYLDSVKERWASEMPLERMLGIIATQIFIIIFGIGLLSLFLSQLLTPTDVIVTISNPSLSVCDSWVSKWVFEAMPRYTSSSSSPFTTAFPIVIILQDFKAIADVNPVCPCRRATNELHSFARQSIEYDATCDPGIDRAWDECRRNMACTGDSSDAVLLVISQFCGLSRKVGEQAQNSANERLVVTPTLMQEDAMDSLVEGGLRDTMNSVISLITIPTIMLDIVNKIENFMTVVGLWGGRAPTTALVPGLGGGSWRVGGDGLREWTFTSRVCYEVKSQVECGMTPFCRWSGELGICDSVLCPFETPEGPLCPGPDGLAFATRTCYYDTDRNGCLPADCASHSNATQCAAMDVVSGAYPIHKNTPSLCTPRLGYVRDMCLAKQLSCKDFKRKDDCKALAPIELCAWNGGSNQCEYIANITCADGTTSDAGTATCLASEAVEISYNPTVPAYVIHAWPNSPTTSELPLPEFFIFTPASVNASDTFASLDPLWRLNTGPASNPCNCIEDPFCISDNITLDYFPDDPTERPLVYQRQCQRYNTVASFSSNIINSKVWNFYNMSPPTDRSSKFSNILEGYSHAFVDEVATDYTYENYFNRCNPSSCSYTEKKIIDPITALTWLLGILGGFSVVAQNMARYSATFCCKGCIARYINSHPEMYGKTLSDEEHGKQVLRVDNPLGNKAHQAAESGVVRLLRLVAELEAESSEEEAEAEEAQSGGGVESGPVRRKKRKSARRATLRKMLKEELPTS